MSGEGFSVNVFLGSLTVLNPRGADLHALSPVATHTELVGAEILLQPGSSIRLGVKAHHEHGVLLDSGTLSVGVDELPVDHLAYLPPGNREITLSAGAQPVRALLIGGEPLNEQILMWWNFVGRTHDEVVEYRRQWQAEIGAEPGDSTTKRFGDFPAGEPDPLPAPVLPTVRLRPRD